MPAGLRALRDNHVRPSLHRFPSLRHSLYLTNQLRSGAVDCRCKGSRVAKRQHDGGGLVDKRAVQQAGLLCKTPSDEPTSDARITCLTPFPFDPFTVSITPTKQTQPARVADCGGKPPTGNEVHRGEQDRMFNAEYLGQPIGDGHQFLLQDVTSVSTRRVEPSSTPVT
jgi:hypothetical protein